MQSYYQHPPILPSQLTKQAHCCHCPDKHRFISLTSSSKRKDLCSINKKKKLHFLESCKPVFSFNSLIPLKRVTQSAWENSHFPSTGLFQSNPAPSLMDGTVISTCARCFSLPFFFNKQFTVPMYQRKRS